VAQGKTTGGPPGEEIGESNGSLENSPGLILSETSRFVDDLDPRGFPLRPPYGVQSRHD
jgi:hypothetical protein